MNYQDTIQWLFQQLPMFQNVGAPAYKKDLGNILKLVERLNHPERKFKSVHVAGTNGKGSTSHILASVLQQAGYNVGLHTSPHLKDFRERIKINGHLASKNFVIQFVKQHKAFLETERLSFFEASVGMAFDYFAKQNVDIAIIEVGLGGRLDSTNIITPELSIITNIGYDHMQFLGDTLTLIAQEKAGIIKSNVPVVIGETQAETKPIFLKFAKKANAPIYFADQLILEQYQTDLLGSYQKHNIKSVVKAVQLLNEKDFIINNKALKLGLNNVMKNTGFQGRWQILSHDPLVVCDTGHNREGLLYVLGQLSSVARKQLHIVLGVVKDKNIDSIIDLFPKDAQYYFCKPDVARGKSARELMDYFISKGFAGKSYASVSAAFQSAKKNASVDDLIFVGGSTFTVAEII